MQWSQQRLAELARLSMASAAGFEQRRSPDASSLARLAAVASEAGQKDIASELTAHMIRELRLDKPVLLASFSRQEKTGPLESIVVITSNDSEEADYLSAFALAFMALRGTSEKERSRARAALKRLVSAAKGGKQ
jgi:transcriptional regulator with XRE-family HTH domain